MNPATARLIRAATLIERFDLTPDEFGTASVYSTDALPSLTLNDEAAFRRVIGEAEVTVHQIGPRVRAHVAVAHGARWTWTERVADAPAEPEVAGV